MDFQFFQTFVQFDNGIALFDKVALFEIARRDDARHRGAQPHVEKGLGDAGDVGGLSPGEQEGGKGENEEGDGTFFGHCSMGD